MYYCLTVRLLSEVVAEEVDALTEMPPPSVFLRSRPSPLFVRDHVVVVVSVPSATRLVSITAVIVLISIVAIFVCTTTHFVHYKISNVHYEK